MNKRTFILGSEWYYVKLYSGPKTLEHVFVSEIYPKIMQLIDNKLVDYFFFIRYMDPDYHIRLRFHLEETNDVGKVTLFLNKLLEDYILNHIITRMTIDTYNREIERYGIEYICDIEKVFYFDSCFILTYLSKCHEDDTNRWLVSSKYIDLLLSKCGFFLNEKIEFCEVMSSSYIKEIFIDTKFGYKQLSEKYRNNRKKMAEIIENNSLQNFDWMEDLNEYLSQITIFIEKMQPVIGGKSVAERFPQLSSIIHMHVNRMFRTKQRVNECVIYYLILKYYKSKNEIKRNNLLN